MRYAAILACLLLSGCVAVRSQPDAEQAALKQERTASARAVDSALAAQLANEEADRRRQAADTQREAERRAQALAIAGAASNLGPIAEVVEIKGEPDLGAAISQQKQTIDTALNLAPSDYPVPVVTTKQLLADAKAALADYRTRAAALQGRLDLALESASAARLAKLEAEATAAQATARANEAEAARRAAQQVAEAATAAADAAARREWWAKVGAGALAIAGTVGMIALRVLATTQGGPLLGLLRMVLPGAAVTKDRETVATAAVAAGDVGRSAVDAVERGLSPELATALATAVEAATGGRASSLAEVFKVAAKAHVIDAGRGLAPKVDALLTTVRDRDIETEGGLPTILGALLHRV